MNLIKSITFILLLFVSCKGNSNSETTAAVTKEKDIVYNINLEESLKSSKELKLSDISDSVNYFELKTPHELPIQVAFFDITKEYIFINSKGIVHQLDLSGNYIRQIGAIGQGPGEYIGAIKIMLNEPERKIYISPYKTVVYSFDGEYLGNIDLGNTANEVFFDRDTAYIAYETYGITKSKMIALKSFRDTLYSIPNYNLFDTKGYSFMRTSRNNFTFTKYNNKNYFKGSSDNDTLWCINGSGYTPHAIIDMGKFKFPEPTDIDEEMERARMFGRKEGDFYQINSILEDDLYLFLNCNPYYNPEMGSPLVVYDKQAMRGFAVEDADGNVGFKDDIEGGPNFIPLLITDDYYFSISEAVDFLEITENSQTQSEKLRKFRRTINEESNPIITFVKRK